MADKHFPEKYRKKLDQFAQGYIETVEGASNEDIKKFILTAERNLFDIEQEKENNANLLKLKEDLKETLAPYNEARSSETAKIKFCIFKLQERGQEI